MKNRIVMLAILFSVMSINLAYAGKPSKYSLNDAIDKANKMEESSKPGFAQCKRFTEANRLEEIDSSMGDRPRAMSVARTLLNPVMRAVDAYQSAIKAGWPQDNSDLVKARADIEAMLASMKECGVWTSFSFDDASHSYTSQFDQWRGFAWHATFLVKQGNLDKAKEQFEYIKKRFDRVHMMFDDALDQGQKNAVDVRTLPAYKRTVTEIERLKGICQPAFAKNEALRASVDKDVEQILAHNKNSREIFDKVSSAARASGTFDGMVQTWEKTLPITVDFETKELPEINKFIKEFGAKYGATSTTIENKIRAIKGGRDHSAYSPGSAYEDLVKRIVTLDEDKKNIAGKLYKYVDDYSKKGSQYRQKALAETFAKYTQMLDTASKYTPQDKKIASLLSDLSVRQKKILDESNAKIDKMNWPGHSEKFQGPGDADDLADAALQWFQQDAGWIKAEDPLMVRVSGDWHVGEKDVLGQPLNWGLPIWVATRKHQDKEAGNDVAWVFYGSVYTRDPKKELPWQYFGVGGNDQIRLAKLQASTGGGSGPGIIFRLLLVIPMLLCGLLAATPLLKTLNPQLALLLDKLTPLKVIIGVVGLGVGVLLLLKNLFYLSPLADILPQAIVIVTGLFLGMELLMSKRLPEVPNGTDKGKGAEAMQAASSAATKAQDLLVKHKAKLESLQQYQIPMGIACLVLGFLHLFASNWTLF